MAVITITTKMASGVLYTQTTASSSDWSGVTSDTNFFDLTDKTVHYKDTNGFIQSLYRQVPSIQTITSSATVTPTSSDDLVDVTAQAEALIIDNPTGAYENGQNFLIRVADDGTIRAITYGDEYIAFGSALPTATVVGKTTLIGCTRNSAGTGTFETVNSLQQ